VCPEGVDGYFDNVGGPTLEAALTKMNNFGKIVFCGSISEYNEMNGSKQIAVKGFDLILMRRLTVHARLSPRHPHLTPPCPPPPPPPASDPHADVTT
jgi:NADPH-dependent curcumin reductase CurA